MVRTEFNPAAFINAADFPSTTALIEYIKEVDNNDELYNSYLQAPIFNTLIPWPKLFWDRIYPELIQRVPSLEL